MQRRDIDRRAVVRLAGATTETLAPAGRLGRADDGGRVDSLTVTIDSPLRVPRQQEDETAVLEGAPIELTGPEDR
ncbi:hypothetical protein [Natronorubrum sp. DTA7]|uniref:hypothetical protein n=1 Tax=Natronorubrum sp. DTA7 TaxID=3447016 RepID=UPI003F8650DF